MYKKEPNIMQYHGKDRAMEISRQIVIPEVKVKTYSESWLPDLSEYDTDRIPLYQGQHPN